MQINKLKETYNYILISVLAVSAVIIVMTCMKDFKIYVFAVLIGLSAFVVYKRTYWGGLGFIALTLLIYCLPSIGEKTYKIHWGNNKLFFSYLILNIIYLELISRLRMTSYLSAKYGSSGTHSFTVTKKHQSETSILRDLFSRLLLLGGIFICVSFIYNLTQKYYSSL